MQYTDEDRNVACKYCCLLAQEDEDVVVKRIVGFYSRKFCKTEMTYSKMEKKMCVQWCGVCSEQAGEICIGQGISAND